MSASYQCSNCGQIVPVIELDETGPVHCPACQGAMRSGPPPIAPPPPVSDAHIVPPIPPWRAEPSVPERWDDDDPDEIDIRRRGPMPDAPSRAAPSSGRAKHVIWPLIVVGFVVLRLFSHVMRNDRPQVQQFNVPQVQFQMPNAGGLGQPPQEVLVQRASWSEQLPDGLRASRLVLSGLINPRIGVIADDRGNAETTFIGLDGETGANAGHLVWKARVRPVRFSLSDDGSRLAVLLLDAEKATKGFQFYALPQANPVGGAWYPFPQANDVAADDVWFEMLGPDRLLTVFQHRQLELWSVPDGKRLYSVDLEPAPKESRNAVALSLDRRLVAVANDKRGFTFHDTASGAIRGQTAAVPGNVTQLANCAFSPDGKRLGCQLTVADPPQEKWIMWSCRNGAIEGAWDRLGAGTGWLFWDDRHVLFDAGGFAEWQLVNAPDGKSCGFVDNDANFLAASTGRRLWYVCHEPFAVAPAVHVASIELQPHWFQNPQLAANGWILRREGFCSGPPRRPRALGAP